MAMSVDMTLSYLCANAGATARRGRIPIDFAREMHQRRDRDEQSDRTHEQ